MTPQHAESQDFRTYLRSLWRWKLLVLGLLVVVPAISYYLEIREQPQYRSSTLVKGDTVEIDSSLFPTAPSGRDSLLTVARLVQTRTIANAAGQLLRPPEPGGAIAGLISVEPDKDTGFLTISATSPDPRRAADVANAFAQAISANRAEQVRGQIDAAINGLKRERAELPPADPERRGTAEEIQKLRTLRSTLLSNRAIVERAVPSATPVGRNTRRAIELGIVIALLLGAGAVALAESSDRRLRRPDDLEELTGLPLLSAIPASAFASNEGEERDEEAFQMLRAALTYFNVDRRLASVVIASPGQEDGKTTVAVRLAYALARAGSNVILVDADLRRPRIGPWLGLPLTAGLGNVLLGERRASETLIDIPVHSPDAPDTPVHGTLRLLQAGAKAPNPAELLSSSALPSVLGELEQEADMVIIDSAAALAVSDTLPLLQAASGVVLIARLNRSTRSAVRRLQQVTTAAGGTMLGVVATGASTRGGYEYGYGYTPVPEPRDARRTTRDPQPPPEPVPSAPRRTERAPEPGVE